MIASSALTRPAGRSIPGASLDLDFARQRGWVGGKRQALSRILKMERASTALGIGAGGLYREFAANEPRIVYTPDGAGDGLMAEGDGANFCLHSGDLSNAAWTKSTGAAASANAALGPDGKLSASRCFDTQPIASTPGEFSQATTILADLLVKTDYFIVRPGTIWRFKLLLAMAVSGTSVTVSAIVDLKLGIIVSQTGPGLVRIWREPLGYFGISLTAYNVNNTLCAWSIQRASPDDAPGFFDVWHCQLENFGAATSPIKTTNAPATRARERPYLPLVAAPWWSATQGWFYVEADLRGALDADATLFVARLDFDSYIWVSRSGAFSTINVGIAQAGVSQAAFTFYSASHLPATFRVAMRYGPNDFAAAHGGGNALYADIPQASIDPPVDTSGSVPTGLVFLDIGCFAQVTPANGVIKRLAHGAGTLTTRQLSEMVA